MDKLTLGATSIQVSRLAYGCWRILGSEGSGPGSNREAGARAAGMRAIYLTGGSSALRPFQQALRSAFAHCELVEGDLFGGVASGLAYSRV